MGVRVLESKDGKPKCRICKAVGQPQSGRVCWKCYGRQRRKKNPQENADNLRRCRERKRRRGECLWCNSTVKKNSSLCRVHLIKTKESNRRRYVSESA